MRTKIKRISIVISMIFVLFGTTLSYLYYTVNIVNAAPFVASNTIYSIKCIKDGFGTYTGSGYLDITYNSDDEASYKRRYLLDRPGRLTVGTFITSPINVNTCPNFVAPASNTCVGRGSGHYDNWVEYNSIPELKVLINSNAPIKRLSSSDYSINGNYTTVSGFGGVGFIDKTDVFYDSTQKTYTFLNSLVELKIDLGNSSSTGYIELYQTSSGGLGVPTLIEQLSFLNVNSDGPNPSLYTGHNIGVLGSGDEISGDQREFFYTGSLFSDLNVANQVGGPIVLPSSNVSLSGALIGLSGSTISLSSGVFGLPISTLNLGSSATVSLSGSTVSLNGNSISLTNSNLLGVDKLDFGNSSIFSITSGTTLNSTPISLDGSIAYLSGALLGGVSNGSLNGNNVSLAGSVGTLSGSNIGLLDNISFGLESLYSLSKSINLNGSKLKLSPNTISLSGSILYTDTTLLGLAGTNIAGLDTLTLGTGSNIILGAIPVPLNGSKITITNSYVLGSGSVMLGIGSNLVLLNDLINTSSNINGSSSVTLNGGYIKLGPNSITTLSGTTYLGYGDITLERREFTRTEKGYIYSSTNVDDYYDPIKGVGSNSINVAKGSLIELNGCDTESTVEINGSGNRCPKDVSKAYRYGNKKSVKLKLKRKKLNCELDHFNTPGVINSSTTIISPIIPLPSVPNSSIIIPSTNYFSYKGQFLAGVYTGSTINGGGFDYLGRMIVEATGGNYHIEGIEYVNPFNGTGTLEKIIGQLTVDGDLLDVIGDSSTPTGSFINQGLGSHQINDLVQDRNFNIETTVRGNYEFNLQFFDKTVTGDLIEIDSINFPLTIIPTNNMEVIGVGDVSYPGMVSGTFPYANNDQMSDTQDVAKICYNVQDEFGNPIGYKSYSGIDKYTAINGVNYNSMRTPDFGNYQTGTGNNIQGGIVDFSLDFGSHLLSRASIVTGIKLNQKTSVGEAIEIRDNGTDSGPYKHGPGYVYGGPGDIDHLVTFQGSKACFNIQSYAPANQALNFQLTIPKHNRDYDLTPDGTRVLLSNSTNTTNVRFEKPYSGNFHIDDDGEFKVGTEQTMRIDIRKNNNKCSSSICSSNFNISNYLNSFRSINAFYSVLRKNSEINTSGTVSAFSSPIPWMVPLAANRTKLDFVLNYVSGDKITSHPLYGVESDLWITNNVDGKDVTYRVNSTEIGGSNTWMNQDRTAFYGVKSLGSLEGESVVSNNDSGYTITGQQSNFSNIDKLEMRKTIKNNAYDLLRNRASDIIIDGVRYVEGDVSITGTGIVGAGNQLYDTLIIKNGNLTISGSGKVITKNLGLIVIKDDLDNKTMGNLYVTPDVREIRAMIYLDGSILSKPNTGYYTHNGSISGIPEDSPTRTKELQKQLILKGSLFSRNTIGGSVGVAPFTCPGGSNCSSFDEAVKYDLNYLRRGFDMCDHNNDGDCLDLGEYENVGFVVEYNPQNQINPPKGFENE